MDIYQLMTSFVGLLDRFIDEVSPIRFLSFHYIGSFTLDLVLVEVLEPRTFPADPVYRDLDIEPLHADPTQVEGSIRLQESGLELGAYSTTRETSPLLIGCE
ncbi:hypothetical protein EVAR_37649_1 [Eumeta japonica]|uniref:Uncharacterized protein n=1 Tax=Eumeta variegata TaxID=151549 RepID=A0A4C1VM83_EUMVA|nr:hypothetical protein EVAR_37649_1 [Eumeta japonica]